MGLLFNRKTSNGHLVDRKIVRSGDLSHRDIRKIKNSLRGTNYEKKVIEKVIKEAARSGSANIKEVHELIQKEVAKGNLQESDARNFSKALGMKGKRYLHYDDISESKEKNEKSESEENQKEDCRRNNESDIYKGIQSKSEKNVGNFSAGTNGDSSQKSRSFWDLWALRKQK